MVKSYEKFHRKILTGQNDALQSLELLDSVNIDKYAEFDPNIPCGSRVMSIFTKLPRLMLSKALSVKTECYACHWLDNVDMHMYANVDLNIHVRGAFGKFLAWYFISVTYLQTLSCLISF